MAAEQAALVEASALGAQQPTLLKLSESYHRCQLSYAVLSHGRAVVAADCWS
jgi:hypothetical protein